MCKVCAVFLCFFAIYFIRASSCLKDVVLKIEPRVVQLGAKSVLRCTYDLEEAPLYTVKWYRGHHEFYRYTPKEFPSTKIFPFVGVHVDLKSSNEHQVALEEVGFNLSGNFSCEVTTDAPHFTTRVVSADMLVVVLPVLPPKFETEKTLYDIGDILKANCTSAPSRPAATLVYYLNGQVVCEKCVLRKHPTGSELFSSSVSLELPLFPSHFHNGRLTLKCLAEIGDLYRREVELSLYNVNQPRPAQRVTQSSASIAMVKINIGLILILHLCNT